MQTAQTSLSLYLRRRRRRRIGIIIAGLIALAVIVALIFFALQNKASFFRVPSDITAADLASPRQLRLGGYVAKGSVRHGPGAEVDFAITDFHRERQVRFNGILPDLFREGQGVIAEGHFDQSGLFIAERVLAKHDEKYVPKNVADRIKAAGGADSGKTMRGEATRGETIHGAAAVPADAVRGGEGGQWGEGAQP